MNRQFIASGKWAVIIFALLSAFACADEPGTRAPQGTIKTFTFSQSRIFPGTRRQGWVFIPAQYGTQSSPAKPACVYVR